MMYIDPHGGWQWGFPKLAPTNLREMCQDDLTQWLKDNGYPESEIDLWKGKVPCRFLNYE